MPLRQEALLMDSRNHTRHPGVSPQHPQGMLQLLRLVEDTSQVGLDRLELSALLITLKVRTRLTFGLHFLTMLQTTTSFNTSPGEPTETVPSRPLIATALMRMFVFDGYSLLLNERRKHRSSATRPTYDNYHIPPKYSPTRDFSSDDMYTSGTKLENPGSKEFFEKARKRLSYDQYQSLLNNVKELNAFKQTAEETIEVAKDIFGEENGDLLSCFSRLLK